MPGNRFAFSNEHLALDGRNVRAGDVDIDGDPRQNETVAVVVNAIANDVEPIVSGVRAPEATEIVFGVWCQSGDTVERLIRSVPVRRRIRQHGGSVGNGAFCIPLAI